MTPAAGGSGSPPFVFPETVETKASPDYLPRHSGPCLVVGSAWTMQDDFDSARALRPGAAVFAINRTAGHIRADFLVTIDRNKAEGWRRDQERNFGLGHFTLHGGKFGAHGENAYPWFDHFWTGLQTGGTSAWLAAKIAAAMGFREIILCGAPLSPGPYMDGEDDWSRRNDDQMNAYREPIRKDAWMHRIVRSMSGWTREELGCAT